MFKSARTIALFTLLSRIFGYIRDLTIASFLGASIYTDMFFIAFRIPNSLRRFLGEGAVNSAVVPVLSKLSERDKPKAIWNLIFYFSVLLVFVTVIGVLFSKVLIVIFAAGYLHNHFQLMNRLVKLIFPYIFFIGLTVLFMGILNSFKHFAIPSFAPALLNISIIASLFFLFGKFENPIYPLCIGVLVGGFLQLFVSSIDFFTLKLPFDFSLKIEKTTVEIFKLMAISAVGSSIIQISSMVDGFVASFLKTGSFSYIFYANRLFQLPFAVFSIALAQGSLPDLSRLREKNLKDAISLMSRFVVFYSLIIVVYVLFYSFDIVKFLFMHGKFNKADTLNVSLALNVMISGFLFFSLTKIFSNAFYSKKDAKTPLKATIIASLASIVLSIVLGFTMGFLGLAISMSISGVVNFFVIILLFIKRFGKVDFGSFIDKAVLLGLLFSFIFSLALKKLPFGFVVDGILVGLILILGYRHYSRLSLEASSSSS